MLHPEPERRFGLNRLQMSPCDTKARGNVIMSPHSNWQLVALAHHRNASLKKSKDARRIPGVMPATSEKVS